MDRWEAQYNFWASFGIPAYEENSVPDLDEVVFPYLTYEAAVSGFDESAMVSVSIWTRSTSWAEADTLADNIEGRIKNGGALLPYDNGVIWATPSTPFAQNMGDESDDRIKRKILNINLQF